MAVTEVYRLPVHGSYIYDAWKELNGQPLFAFTGARYDEIPDENVYNVLLGLTKLAYPEATMESLHRYNNKCFTVIAMRRGMGQLVVLYRHDWSWRLSAVDTAAFLKYADAQSYRARPNLNELPEY